MKLRSQILALGLSGALLAGFAGGIGLYTSSQLGASLSGTVKASQALPGALEKNAELIASARAETFDAALNVPHASAALGFSS